MKRGRKRSFFTHFCWMKLNSNISSFMLFIYLPICFSLFHLSNFPITHFLLSTLPPCFPVSCSLLTLFSSLSLSLTLSVLLMYPSYLSVSFSVQSGVATWSINQAWPVWTAELTECCPSAPPALASAVNPSW